MRAALRLLGGVLCWTAMMAVGGLFIWACDVAGRAVP